MTPTHPPQIVVVIGAGLMGHAIAYLMARAGHQVRVFDRDAAMLGSLPARLSALSAIFGDDAEPAQRIRAVPDLGVAASGADFAIEAVVEDLVVKQSIVAELEAVMAPDAIITSNTSALPITGIAENAIHRGRVVGTHFWNPPHLVKLVEVTQAAHTSDETVARTIALMEAAGHRAVHVRKDIPGFIGNRLQHALKREAIALVASGVCDAATVDEVVKLGFGRRMAVLGPLEQTDLVGLPLTKAIHETLMPDLDRTDTPHPYLEQLIDEGRFGMSSGQGFYDWTEESAKAVRDRLSDFLVAQSRADEDGQKGRRA